MGFNTHEAYTQATSSEKIALAFIHPRKALDTFEAVTANVWRLRVEYFLNNLYIDNEPLDQAASTSVDASNPWYYDIQAGYLYYYTESDSPDDDALVGEFKLFFSNAPINLTHDLNDTGETVPFEPRLNSKAGFKSDIGSDQMGISVTGSGKIYLDNQDKYFDDMFERYIWDNKSVEVYSYNRDLPPSEAKLTFKGVITDKSFNLDKVSFKINDSIYKLDTKVPMNLFQSADGVSESYVGDAKRIVYGKVDGLLCRSIDQVPENGALIGGTVSGTAATTTITGSGTEFLKYIAQNDTIYVNGEEYSVEKVNSDTELIISDTDGLLSTFVGEGLYVSPEVPSPEFNREFFIADHAIKQASSTITSMTQLNRLSLADASDFEAGDIVKIGADTFTIRNISGNKVQINITADDIYPNGTLVTKEPITEYFIQSKAGSLVDIESITNTADARFTLSNRAEFRITRNKLVADGNFSFTNGSRVITYAGPGELDSTFRERDWIKVEGDIDSRFIRIVDVSETEIRCATAYQGPSQSNVNIIKRRPEYISNESEVSVNCYGKTDDGSSTGNLIETGAGVVKDLISSAGLSSVINEADFNRAVIDNRMRMSIKIPASISDSPPNLKDVINKINKTVFGSLALKQDFTLGYFINSPELYEDIRVIRDDDVIKWDFKGGNTTTYKSVISNYRFTDYDLTLKDESSKTLRYSSSSVAEFDLSNKEVERDFLSYEEGDTQELSERFIFFNETLYTELKITSDLRLSDLEVGDVVDVRFRRLYSSNDIVTNYFRVIGITVNYNETKLTLSNFGDLYNKGARIASDDAFDYGDASAQERKMYGYITDENGLMTGHSETRGKNLIS